MQHRSDLEVASSLSPWFSPRSKEEMYGIRSFCKKGKEGELRELRPNTLWVCLLHYNLWTRSREMHEWHQGAVERITMADWQSFEDIQSRINLSPLQYRLDKTLEWELWALKWCVVIIVLVYFLLKHITCYRDGVNHVY